MFIKVFTIEFSRTEGSFSDSEVTNFLEGKELITVKDYLLEVVGKKFFGADHYLYGQRELF